MAMTEAGFNRLVDQHRSRILAYCLRRTSANDADDAAAEVFAVAWRRRNDMPAGPEALPWLYGVARNVVKDQWRGTRRRRNLLTKVAGHRTAEPRNPEDVVVEHEDYRLVRAALEYCIANGRKSLTFVHKGNIMKFTEGAFRNWGYELAEREFGDQTYTWDQWERTKADQGAEAANAEQDAALSSGKVLVKDAIADITLQQVLTRPKEFDVIATMNLNGDYLSDALAAQVGGIGIAPGGNINYASGHSVFEATHGTAPKYANKDVVNPGSLVLSGEMMLRYMGWTEAADAIIASMDTTIGKKTVTYDFARLMEDATKVKCSEFGDALIANM